MSRRPSAAVSALALAGLAASYLATRRVSLTDADRRLAAAVRRPRGARVDAVVSVATDLGSMYAVAGAAAVMALSGRRGAAIDVVGAGALGWTAAQAMKRAVNRERPYEAEVDVVERLVAIPAGTSWPSGHPAVAAACAAALAPRLGPGGRLAAGTAAGFVAASRVYVGVHYPTDVVAGLGLGVLTGAVWRRLVPGR